MVAKLDKLERKVHRCCTYGRFQTYHSTSLTYPDEYLPTYQRFYQEVGRTSTKEEGRSGGFLALFGLVLTLPKIPFPAGGKAVRLCPRRETQLRVWCSVSDLRQSFFPRSSSAYNIQTHWKRERRRRRRREREIIDAWEEATEVGSERRECGDHGSKADPSVA